MASTCADWNGATGKTFHWHGRYHEDMNKRDTVSLALNVFEGFNPTLLPDQQRCDYLFLANISPELQYRVLSQVQSPKLVAADTMDFWIQNARPHLTRLLERLDLLTVNDDEARMLTGEHNLVKAGRAILQMGPKSVLVKRGEYGVLQFSKEGMFAVPAYPLEDVVDPDRRRRYLRRRHHGFPRASGAADGIDPAHRGGLRDGDGVVQRGKFFDGSPAQLTWEEIDHRYRAFIELTDSHSNRWNSPS